MKLTVKKGSILKAFKDLYLGESFILDGKCYTKVEIDDKQMAYGFNEEELCDIYEDDYCIPCNILEIIVSTERE